VYARVNQHPELEGLALRQRGVVHRRQFSWAGVSRHEVEAHLVAERWRGVGNEVVLLQNAPPNRRQLMWVAVLDAGECALGSHTSLELAGFSSFAAEAQLIHLVVPRGHKVTPLQGVRVHESRRLQPEQSVFTDGLPRTATPRSVLDAAAWQPHPRFAATMVAAAVQQRLVTPAELRDELRRVGRIRHKQYLREAVLDAAAGAHSAGELDLARMCRRFGLAAPDRQVPRRDASGVWRFTDAEWDLPHRGVAVLEVDGKQHMDAVHWQADMRRERAIVIGRRWVLRATNFEVRHEPFLLVRDLLALGVPRIADLSESQPPLAG
jgi:hypothetical protein